MRHGDWEPFLERFDFGLSMNLAESTSLTVQRVIKSTRDFKLDLNQVSRRARGF